MFTTVLLRYNRYLSHILEGFLKIIRTELHKFAEKLIGSGDVHSIAQSLYRERRKVYPIFPKSREDVHAALDSMATLTSKDEEFVQVNSIETGIVILSCLPSLKFLVNSVEEIFIDGTFKCCPKYFYQLYTIRALSRTGSMLAHTHLSPFARCTLGLSRHFY